MRRHALSVAASVGVGLGLAGPAFGHGPAPAALEVLSTDQAGAVAVRLNFGLAVRKAGALGHFRYVCPGMWRQDETVPPMGRFADGSFVVPLPNGPRVGDASGCGFAPLEAPDWADQTFISQAGREPVWLVTRDETGSSLWAASGAAGQGSVRRVEFFAEVKLDSVSVSGDGALWLLSARPIPRIFRRTDAGLTSRELALGVAPQYLSLRWQDASDPAHFLFAANIDEGVRLFETADAGERVTERLRATERLHGPVSFGASLVASADGVWQTRGPGEASFVAGAAAPFTCLQSIDGLTLACLDRQIVRLEGAAARPNATPFFELDALDGPEAGCPAEPSAALTCEQQWLHFGGEAGLARRDAGQSPVQSDAGGDATVVKPSAEPVDDSGCGVLRVAKGGGSTAWWALALMFVRRIRRHPRSNFSNPSRIP